MNKKPVFAALLIPYRGDTVPACSAKTAADYAAGTNVLMVEVTLEGQRHIVRRNLKAKTATLGKK